MRFQGRRAVVTGGLSGIGEAVAKRITAEGGKVVVWDMQGGIKTDISNWDSVQAAAAETVKELGGIDILVNSAGIAGPTATVLDITMEDWHRTIAINLNGTFFTNRAVVPHMIAGNYGRIVNIASIAGKEGNPNAVPYSAAKSGVLGLTKAVAKEVATKGVLVNAITPAVIETEILKQVSEEHVKYMTSKIPMGRVGQVHEVAALAAWLCSDEVSFSTGATFDISGGRATY